MGDQKFNFGFKTKFWDIPFSSLNAENSVFFYVVTDMCLFDIDLLRKHIPPRKKRLESSLGMKNSSIRSQ